jgi:hypothetical protein
MVIIGLFVCALLISCTLRDGEVRQYGPYRVGSIYECTAALVLVEPETERARLMTLDDCAQCDKIETYAGRSLQNREELPRGTRFELVSIYRKNQSSWNNGISYFCRSTARILSGPRSNETVQTDELFRLLEGQGGKPLEVPLRLVGRAGETSRR